MYTWHPIALSLCVYIWVFVCVCMHICTWIYYILWIEGINYRYGLYNIVSLSKRSNVIPFFWNHLWKENILEKMSSFRLGDEQRLKEYKILCKNEVNSLKVDYSHDGQTLSLLAIIEYHRCNTWILGNVLCSHR